jgi:DNA-binding transcriptional regulator YhcF (GntR family)
LSEAYNTGVSIRQAAKDFGLNRGTVRRYYRLLSERGG